MLVCRISIKTTPDGQADVVEQLLRGEREIPEMFQGCERFEVFVHPDDATRIMLIEEWVDREAADRYFTSDYFKKIGAIIRPALAQPPNSAYYQATQVGP